MKPGEIAVVYGKRYIAVGSDGTCTGCVADPRDKGHERICDKLPSCSNPSIIFRPAYTSQPMPTPPIPNQGEADPNGKSANEPGAKLDAGKVRPSLIIEGMARAIWAVSEIATFGATKYADGGWVTVPNGQTRYADAGYRHTLKRAKGEVVDADSQKLHLAHEAWNALAKLDLFLREQETK